MKKLKLFLTSIIAMFVAVVGVHAETLKDCLDGATTEGVTCTFTDDEEELYSTYITVSNKATIDLDGKELNLTHTLVVGTGATLKITSSNGKGTINATTIDNGQPIAVMPGGTLEIDNVIVKGRTTESTNHTNYQIIAIQGGGSSETKFTLGSNAEITGYNTGVGVFGTDTDGGKQYADKVVVDIYGKITTDSMAVSINGVVIPNENADDAVINIYDGAEITSTDSAALYAAGYGTYNVKGGTLTGTVGVVARQGDVSITGGTIIANGEAGTTDKVGSNNTEVPLGVAVVVDNTTAGYTDSALVEISGGDFKATAEEAVHSFNEGEGHDIVVRGGTFNKTVATKYLASNELGQSESGVVGKLHKIEITKPENGKVESYTNAAEGEEVVVKIAADKGYEINSITILDKDGKEVKFVSADGGIKFTMPASDVTISATFKKIETPVTNTTEENPKTGDNILMYLGLGLASVAIATLSVKKLRKSN